MIRPTVVKVTRLLNMPRWIRRAVTNTQLDILENTSYLAALADATGAPLIPSQAHLAKKSGCCQKTVQRAFERFAALGLVRKTRRWPLRWSEWRSNLYEFSADLLAWAREQYREQVQEYTNRTFVSSYPSSDTNTFCKKLKNAPEEGASPLSSLARKAQNALFLIPLRHPPPEPSG